MPKEKEKIFRWIHISDIHIGHDEYIEDAMRKDLPVFLKKIFGRKSADCLFITGDLVFAPKYISEEKDISNKEPIIKCVNDIKASLNISSANTFIVPGNHDIVRASLRSTCLRDEIKRYRSQDGTLSQDVIEVNNSAKERYGKLYEAILGRTYQSGHHIEYSENGSQIVCLDTTLFCEVLQSGNSGKKEIMDGSLILGSKNLHECFSEINPNSITFVLGHHPMDAFLPDEREMLCREMRIAGVNLYFCGHTHTGDIKNVGTLDSPIWQVSCGTNMEKLENGDPADMLIYIGEYSITKQRGCIQPYCYNNHNLNKLKWIKETRINFPRTKVEEDHEVDMFYFPKNACPADVVINKYNQFIERAGEGTELYVGPNIFKDSTTSVEGSAEDASVHCIIADAGYGKSYFEKRLLRHFGAKNDNFSWTVPIKLQATYEQILFLHGKKMEGILRKFNPIEFVADTVLELKNEGKFRYKEFFIQWSDRCAKSGNQLILVDGLDGIGNEKQRIDFLESIVTYLDDNPEVDIVMTSKPYIFENISLKKYMDNCIMYKMTELNASQIAEYCNVWFKNKNNTEKGQQLIKKIFNDDTVHELAQIPLLLETLLQVNSLNDTLPNNRVTLFREWIHVLLKDSDKVEEDINLLAAIALYMSKNNIYEINENALKKQVKEIRKNCNWYFIENSGSLYEAPCDFLNRISCISRIMKYTDTGKTKIWSFYHDIFQEYLASIAIVNGIYPDLSDDLKRLGQDKHKERSPVFSELMEMAVNSEKQDIVAFAAAQLGAYEASEVTESLIKLAASLEGRENQINLRNLLIRIVLEGAHINGECRAKIYKVVQEENLSDLQANVFLRMSISRYGEEFKASCSPYMNEMFELIGESSDPVGELLTRIHSLLENPDEDIEVQLEKQLYVLDGIIWATGLRFIENIDGKGSEVTIEKIFELVINILLNNESNGISVRRACGVLHRVLNIRPDIKLEDKVLTRIFQIFAHEVDKKYSKVQLNANYSGIRIINKIALIDEYLVKIKDIQLDTEEKECLKKLFELAPTDRDKISAFRMSVLGRCWNSNELSSIIQELFELNNDKYLVLFKEHGFLLGY